MSDKTGVSYSIVGADGKRYGPVGFEGLRGWVAEGRVRPSTQVILEPGGEQVAAETIAGLFDPGAMPHVQPTAPPPSRTKPWVWIVGGCALVSLCGCGVLGAILFPIFSAAKQAAKRTVATSNLRQLATGVLIYTSDFDDAFPPHMENATAVRPYIQAYVRPRDVTDRTPDLFASMNPAGGEILGDRRLSGRLQTDLLDPSNAVMLYDSLPWNKTMALFAMADGSSRYRSHDQLDEFLSTKPFDDTPKKGTKPKKAADE